jgi:RNA polymerase sigma-70 factor, ECF subfamily
MLSFEAVYRQYANDVYRLALWLCGNAAMAEDVTTETFIRAWAGYDEAKGSSVKSYLLTIARHLVQKWGARRAREELISPELPDKGPSADDRLAITGELTRVLSALQRLPEVDRAALALRVEEDLSYEEIASILEISVSAAKVKVHRARLKLTLARAETDDKPIAEGAGSEAGVVPTRVMKV